MMTFLRKHQRTIFAITIGGFLSGTFIGFGGYFFGGNRTGNDPVVVINGVKIPYNTYSQVFSRMIDQARSNPEQPELTPEFMAHKKQEALQDVIQEEVFWQEANKYGIAISDKELAADIQHYPAFQKDGVFDQRTYYQVLGQMLRTTPRKFEEVRRRQIAAYKLRHLIASSIAVSEYELRMEYARANKGDMSAFMEKRADFSEKLRQEKVSYVFNEWFKALNQHIKIDVKLDEFEKEHEGHEHS